MADQKVTELPIKNQSAINVADYLFGIDAAEGYQMLISDLAKKIIEDFTGSTLGGSSQALKTIIDAINTKIGNTAMGTTATTITGAIKEHETDISTLNGNLGRALIRDTVSLDTGTNLNDVTMGIHFCVSSKSYLNMPGNATYGTLIHIAGSYPLQMLFTTNTMYYRMYANSTWNNWNRVQLQS